MEAIWLLLDKLAPALVDTNGPTFSIDDHVRMVADAKRYRWLRDKDRIEDPDADLLVVRGDEWLSGAELDTEIDVALRLNALGQQVVQEQQP